MYKTLSIKLPVDLIKEVEEVREELFCVKLESALIYLLKVGIKSKKTCEKEQDAN